MKSQYTLYPFILFLLFWIAIFIQGLAFDTLFFVCLFLAFCILLYDFKRFKFTEEEIIVYYPILRKRIIFLKKEIEYVQFKKKWGSGQMTEIRIKLKGKKIFFFNRKYYFIV
jgi:hypothetical protein